MVQLLPRNFVTRQLKMKRAACCGIFVLISALSVLVGCAEARKTYST